MAKRAEEEMGHSGSSAKRGLEQTRGGGKVDGGGNRRHWRGVAEGDDVKRVRGVCGADK
jgi:hypothetical protein